MSEELQIYEVTNRDTGERHLAISYNAQDACKQAGWLIGDCFTVEQKPTRKPTPDGETGLLYKVPCRVCPFRYGECKKPADKECPVRPNAPELKEWLKQITEARLCHYSGQELSEKDYHSNHKWIPLEQAIEELGDHH
ncbi:unnamed protein product [marine sediment metagenome]|uniref:Uncharacterized protein n=1 Tax=marine sediment metagenome TaxID=412755 RepID=X1SS48_9ZZZZ